MGGIGDHSDPHCTVWFGPQVTTGGVLSPSTMTLKEQVAELPRLSVIVHVTVFVPTGNGEPDGGVATMLEMVPPQVLLVRLGNGKLMLVVTPGCGNGDRHVCTTMFDGQTILRHGGNCALACIVNASHTPQIKTPKRRNTRAPCGTRARFVGLENNEPSRVEFVFIRSSVLCDRLNSAASWVARLKNAT